MGIGECVSGPVIGNKEVTKESYPPPMGKRGSLQYWFLEHKMAGGGGINCLGFPAAQVKLNIVARLYVLIIEPCI